MVVGARRRWEQGSRHRPRCTHRAHARRPSPTAFFGTGGGAFLWWEHFGGGSRAAAGGRVGATEPTAPTAPTHGIPATSSWHSLPPIPDSQIVTHARRPQVVVRHAIWWVGSGAQGSTGRQRADDMGRRPADVAERPNKGGDSSLRGAHKQVRQAVGVAVAGVDPHRKSGHFGADAVFVPRSAGASGLLGKTSGF